MAQNAGINIFGFVDNDTSNQVRLIVYSVNNHHLVKTYEYQLYGSSEVFSLGDVNQDNNIDVLDITIIVSYMLGYISLEADIVQIADFNMDLNIDILDIVAIVYFIMD